MGKSGRRGLSPYQRQIVTDFIDDQIGVTVVFSKTRACHCCGNVGWVPEHFRFLCVFCYVKHQTFDPHESEDYTVPHGWMRGDVPRMAIPYEGDSTEPETYYTQEFSDLEFTQEELRMILDS